MAELVFIAFLLTLTLSSVALVNTWGINKRLDAKKERPKLLATRSPELCLFDHIVQSYEPVSSYPGYKIEVPKKKERRKYRGDKATVSLKMDRKGDVWVAFDGNDYVFEPHEQEEAKRIYYLAAAKSRAGAMMLIADDIEEEGV